MFNKMNDMDIVVWSFNQWCHFKDIASYGRNRALNYKIIPYDSLDYIEFLAKHLNATHEK